MKQSKHTLNALLASILSVVLCCALLIGGTFAWFTDSVASGNNQIVAGNLDIELEYKDGNSWKTVTADTNLFMPTEGESATLWEPGHTEYVQLRIRNAGTLALTYDFSVNVYGDENGGEEKEYTNMSGDKFKLSDYLVFSRAAGAEDIGSREDLWLPAEEEADAMGDLSGFAFGGELLAAGSTEEFTLVVYMPISVGNDANQATAAREVEGAPTICLGLTLSATQTPYENDGFGDDYDEDAFYADTYVGTAEELLTAVASADPGDIIGLETDITLSQRLAIERDVVLDLNGKTIVFGGDYESASNNGQDDVTPIRVNEGSLTITGNGTIDATKASDDVVPVSVMNEAGSIVIEDGTFIVDTPRESCVFALGGSVVINGGTFINNSTADYEWGNEGSAPLTLNVSNGTPGTITVYGGIFVGRDPAAGDDNLGGTFVAEGYRSTKVSDGKYVVTDENTTPVAAAGLQEALSNAKPGETVLLTEDVTDDNAVISLYTEGVTLDLNENALNVKFVDVWTEGSVVIKNGTITGSGEPSYGCDGPLSISESLNVTVDNVTVVADENADCAVYCNSANVTLNHVNTTGSVVFNDGFGIINGGSYAARPGDEYLVLSNFGAEINGGTFTVTEADQVIFNVSKPTGDTSFTINDGLFTYVSAPIGFSKGHPQGYILINGGTFNGNAYQEDMYDELLKN